MTIPEAANILGVQPNRATVHNRIANEAMKRQISLRHIFKHNCLTPEAEAVVRRVVAERVTTTTKRGPQPTATVYSEATRKLPGSYSEPTASTTHNSAEAYSKLEAKLAITRQELERVSQYLDDMDTFTGQLVRDFAAMQERLERLEQERRSQRRTGALEAIARMPQVFYSSVLRRQTG